MDKIFIVVSWPEVQELFAFDKFNENAQMLDSIDLVLEFGHSAFLVRKSWLEDLIR